MRFNVQSGSMAERAFSDCGLPSCKPFETVEWKYEGLLRLCWDASLAESSHRSVPEEWIEFHEALRSGVRGMVPPADVQLKAPKKPMEIPHSLHAAQASPIMEVFTCLC